MVVKGVGGVSTPPPGVGRAGAGTPGFTVRSGGDAAGSVAVAAPSALDGLLLLQEVETAPARDRRARRHGRAMLDALARLQLGLLGELDETCLADLATLADACPEAADPALNGVLQAVGLRARIELARHGV